MSFSPAVESLVHQWQTLLASVGPILKGDSQKTTLDEFRSQYTEFQSSLPIREGVSTEKVDARGVPSLLLTPKEVDKERVLLYLHGGGYVFGDPEGYRSLGSNFAVELKAQVLIPAYRLAPENPYPAGIDDCLQAYRWLLEKGYDATSIVIAGDSAGGALTVALLIAIRDAGLPLPAGGAALSPWASLVHSGSSIVSRDGKDPLNNKAGLDLFAEAYLAGAPRETPFASPAFADASNLPPVLIQIGENEVMLSEAMELAAHLGESKVRVILEVWPEMFHVWHFFSHVLPEGRQAIEHAAAFLDEAIRLGR